MNRKQMDALSTPYVEGFPTLLVSQYFLIWNEDEMPRPIRGRFISYITNGVYMVEVLRKFSEPRRRLLNLSGLPINITLTLFNTEQELNDYAANGKVPT